MFVQRITRHPALGKGAQLRALLEERTKARQAQGATAGLQSQLFGAEGGGFVLTVRYEDLAALERDRARNQSDPAFQAFQAKLTGLESGPLKIELFEVLSAGRTEGRTQPIKFLQRVTRRAAPGKLAELRAVLEERAKARQAQGAVAGLQSQVFFGAEGGGFVSVAGYENLAALEQNRTRNQTDAAFQAFQAKLTGLMAGPPKVELFEVLVPLPS